MFIHDSKLLGEKVVILERGEEYVGPKVAYYRSELKALAKLSDEAKRDIHNVKKTMGPGTTVRPT